MQKKGHPLATSGGFMVGDKGTLVIDTMLNKCLKLQVQNMVKAKVESPFNMRLILVPMEIYIYPKAP